MPAAKQPRKFHHHSCANMLPCLCQLKTERTMEGHSTELLESERRFNNRKRRPVPPPRPNCIGSGQINNILNSARSLIRHPPSLLASRATVQSGNVHPSAKTDRQDGWTPSRQLPRSIHRTDDPSARSNTRTRTEVRKYEYRQHRCSTAASNESRKQKAWGLMSRCPACLGGETACHSRTQHRCGYGAEEASWERQWPSKMGATRVSIPDSCLHSCSTCRMCATSI